MKNEDKSPEKTKDIETKDNEQSKEETAVNEITPASDQNGDQVCPIILKILPTPTNYYLEYAQHPKTQSQNNDPTK